MNISNHFNKIYLHSRKQFKTINISKLKTSSGNTQISERICISTIQQTLDTLGYEYTTAGSQQPYDFRVKIYNEEKTENETLLLELKKTDSQCVYFNDTCPCEKAYYIVLFTGKQYKTKDNIPPCLFGINGSEFIEHDHWIADYAEELNALKQKYKTMGTIMSVYPRPTYKANIKFLFNKYFETARLDESPVVNHLTTNVVTTMETLPENGNIVEHNLVQESETESDVKVELSEPEEVKTKKIIKRKTKLIMVDKL